MIADAWARLQSELLSALMGWLLLLVYSATLVAFGYWLGRRRRDFEVDRAVKRDRVLRAMEDVASETVVLPAQRQAGGS